MSNATVDRRTALVALGVATTAGLIAAAGATSAISTTTVADAAPALPPPEVPREHGSLVGIAAGPYTAVHATDVEHGAVVVTLRDATGDAFRVTLCARDESEAALRGPASTARFDVFVDNEGAGDTPTVERHGLAAMDFASGVRLMEHELAYEGLLPLAQRLARHGAEINRAPALSRCSASSSASRATTHVRSARRGRCAIERTTDKTPCSAKSNARTASLRSWAESPRSTPGCSNG